MNIDFSGIKRQYEYIEWKSNFLSAIDKAVIDVLLNTQFIQGPPVRQFEQALSKFTGAKHVISCASGTDALTAALMAVDVGPGDLVFTTPFTFISTISTILRLGALPVFVDIDPVTFNIDPTLLEDAIINSSLGRTKTIIPVDLFGLPADYDFIDPIAQEFNLTVISDAAQSMGATYKGNKVGTLTDITTTSFFPSKPLGCYGDGGAIFTADDKLANTLRSIVNHGQGEHKYDTVRLGLNSRLDTIQAAVLLVKLQYLEEEINKRNKIAKMYDMAFGDMDCAPFIPKGLTSAYAQYSILCPYRTEALKLLSIPTAIYYPKPLHLQPLFNNRYRVGDFPVAEKVSKQIFSIPIHPYLTDEEIEYIINDVRKAVMLDENNRKNS